MSSNGRWLDLSRVITMEPERWQDIDRLCRSVLEIEPGKRDAFLAQECAGDESLRREVETLIANEDEAKEFMKGRAIEAAARVLAKDQIHESSGNHVGMTLLHYRIVERIGQGGMGIVYLAYDEHLQRDVAVKILPSGSLANEAARKRFRQEALALSRLSHPNIGAVYDIDTQDGLDFLVMEFVPGVTLSDSVAAGPLPEHRTVELGLQIASGLEEAHRKGVVHRDLKPANIILSAEGKPKILDFGLAKLLSRDNEAVPVESLTETHAVVGTLPYMAPEQLLGRKVDARTDIHALGAVLYEMCSGRRPFHGNTVPGLTDAILHEAPAEPHSLNPGLSPRLEQLILKCLEKDPDNRYQSAGEVQAELRRLAPSTSTATPRAVLRGNRPRRLVLATGLSLAAILVVVSTWIGHRQPTLAFSNRDWIVIADFDNLTGEEVFDKSLDTALRISIEQSSYVNVLPGRRIADALRRMKKTSTPRVDAAIAREIAEREGIKAVVVPSISGIAGRYALSASIEDPKSGASFRSEITRAGRKEDVLSELDRLAAMIRRGLGESLGSISRQSKPLTKVTTSSLDALKQYSMGIDNHRRGKFGDARTYYENALAIDPDFVSAKSSLGMLHFEAAQLRAAWGEVRFQGIDGDLGKRLLTEAVRQLDNLTDRERFGIQAFYARAVENNLPRAIQHLKASVALYPDDGAIRNNLAWYCRQASQFDESIREYKEAIRIDPGLMLAYDGLSGLYLYTFGRVTDAVALCRSQIARNESHWQAYANLGWACLGEGDLDCARLALEKACELNPKAVFELYRLAHTYRLQKNYPKAMETLRRIPAANPSENIDYDLGVIYERMGEREQAHKCFEHRLNAEKGLRADPKDISSRIVVGVLHARLAKRVPPPPAGSWGPSLNGDEHLLLATLYAVLGRTSEAIEQLEMAVDKGYRNYVYIRVHPDLESLSGNPRFQTLLRKVLK